MSCCGSARGTWCCSLRRSSRRSPTWISQKRAPASTSASSFVDPSGRTTVRDAAHRPGVRAGAASRVLQADEPHFVELRVRESRGGCGGTEVDTPVPASSASSTPGDPAGTSTARTTPTCCNEDVQVRPSRFVRRLAAPRGVGGDIERTPRRSGRHPNRAAGHRHRPRGRGSRKPRDDLEMRRYGQDIHINIQEIQRPEIDAHLIAANVARQLERRIAFRRAMRRAQENAMRFGAQGFRIRCAGRLNGGRDRPRRVVQGGSSSPPHPQGGHRLWLRHRLHHLRHHRCQGVGVPRRAPPGPGPFGAGCKEVAPC